MHAGLAQGQGEQTVGPKAKEEVLTSGRAEEGGAGEDKGQSLEPPCDTGGPDGPHSTKSH